jgi:hypothetical protein
MKSWKETISTSPSGMHLGHHKTLIKPFLPDNPPPETPPELLELESQHQAIVQAQVDLLNLAIKNQYTYERWHNVVNFLLAKEPGIPRCHKLRVIHLYEADLNALIGMKWRQFIHHVTVKSCIYTDSESNVKRIFWKCYKLPRNHQSLLQTVQSNLIELKEPSPGH